MNDKPTEHPTSKQLRKTILQQNQTIEMVAKDRRWLEDELEKALAKNAQLREALERYGVHDDGCGALKFGECNCGYAAALTEQEAKDA